MKNLFRGWIGEKKTAFKMWVWLDTKTYRRFHNIIIPSSNGTTQIDHLIVSPFGIFVVETKNKTGWIFGSPNQKKWTQTIYKNKYTFQNPLRQTYRQKKVMSEFLGLEESFIHTVVYFVGDCKFKTPLPSNVMKSGLVKYIRSFQQPILTLQEVERIDALLTRHKSASTLSKKDHLRSLHQRHNSDTICPKCGSPLLERTARKGRSAGSKFLGCSGFPKCRFTKEIG